MHAKNAMEKITNNSLRSASLDSDSDSLSVDSRETIPDCAVNLRYKLCFKINQQIM